MTDSKSLFPDGHRKVESVRDMYPSKTGEDLLRAMLQEVYTPFGVEVWLSNMASKGLSLDEQLTKAEQLVTGAFI